jgi:hypothetical protein
MREDRDGGSGARRAKPRGRPARKIPGWVFAVGAALIVVGFAAALAATVVFMMWYARPVPPVPYNAQPPQPVTRLAGPQKTPQDPRPDAFGAAGELPPVLSERQPIDGEYPLPQDPARMEVVRARRLADALGVTVGAFDRDGDRNAPGAAAARAALEAYGHRNAHHAWPKGSAEGRFMDALGVAVDAGSTDPRILYLKVRFLDSYRAGEAWGQVEPAEQAGGYRAAAAGLAKKPFGPHLQQEMAWAIYTELEKLSRAGGVGVTAAEVAAARAQFWDAFRVAAREPERESREITRELALAVITHARDSGREREDAWREVDAALVAAGAPAWTRAAVEGEFLVKHAWDARGIGLAGTVTAEGRQLMDERLGAARAKLQAAWDMDREAATPAIRMVTVAMGAGDSRADMEAWFRRAMTADPDSRIACESKLLWLQPKWYGSREDAVAFANQCFRSRNWHAGLPFLREKPLIDVDLSELGRAMVHAKDPEIWGGLRAVQREYCKFDPGDRVTASRFARLDSLAQRPLDAIDYYQAIGKKPWPNVFKDKAEFDHFSTWSLQQVGLK